MIFRREKRKEEKEIDKKEEGKKESRSKMHGFEIKKLKKIRENIKCLKLTLRQTLLNIFH